MVRRRRAERTEGLTRQEQASPEVCKRVRGSFDRQGLTAPLGARKLVASGRQTLIRVNAPER
ncbi:hypothetical protein SAMN05428939_7510 [Streptomyces sp. TLI_105]|nr:hypothetical protein SAMN05428939_7510 [Streptomyces sp. TLI_105]